MNGFREYFMYLPMLVMSILVISCADQPSQESDDQDEMIEVGTEDDGQIEDQEHYTIPSPVEMMEIIRESGTEFKEELLCDPEIHNKYVDLKGKSIGMGIYVADLAYAVSFNRLQETIQNFNVIIKMADEVGIGSSFDERLMERIKNNLNHEDSLIVISDHSYYSIIRTLEENDRGAVVGMMAAGGFLETMFIATQSVDKFDENDHLMQRIADQKLVYENIMFYLGQHNDDQAVEWTIQDFESLREIFNEISDTRMNSKFEESESGKRVLGGKGGVYITEQEFEQLRERISFLRNAITFNSPVPQ